MYIIHTLHVHVLYTGKYSPRFIFAPFALIVIGQIKDLANSLLQIISLLTQLHLGEFKMGQNRLHV